MATRFTDTPPVKIVALLLFLLFCSSQFVPTTNAMAEEKLNNETEQLPEICKEQPIKVQGPANLSRTMAEMNAIIFWHQMVTEKYDDAYADWHKAKAKSISCKKAKPSQYYYCKVAAQACKTDK